MDTLYRMAGLGSIKEATVKWPPCKILSDIT